MARLFPRHCFSRSLDIRILMDGGCFLVSAKSVLSALNVDRLFPVIFRRRLHHFAGLDLPCAASN